MWKNHLFQIAGATSDEKTQDFENWKEQRNEKTEDRTSKFEDQWRLGILECVLEYLGKYIYLYVCISFLVSWLFRMPILRTCLPSLCQRCGLI